MKALYKYPQAEFPYARLVEENRRRGTAATRSSSSLDTGVFDDEPLLRRLRRVRQGVARRHPDPHHGRQPRARQPATLHLLPTLWFRNTWSWGRTREGYWPKPRTRARRARQRSSPTTRRSARFRLDVGADAPADAPSRCSSPRTRRTRERLFGSPNAPPYVKDAFHEYVVHGRRDAVNPTAIGHEGGGALRARRFPPASEVTVRLRLSADDRGAAPSRSARTSTESSPQRIDEADAFYAARLSRRN